MKFKLILFCIWPIFIFGQTSIPEQEAKMEQAKLDFTANPATQNYDLTYCRLEFRVNPAKDSISGDVTPYFKAKETMTQVVFDLKNNMSVSQVSHQGTVLNFSHNGDNLIINLPQALIAGVTDSLTISYSGSPEDGGFGYFKQSEHNGSPILWTLSEPYGAKYWWPTKQDMQDKIDSLDVYIRFPETNANGQENVAVSNGVERSQSVDGTMKTTHFHHGHPIPAYLVAIAVSNYTIFTQQVSNNGNPFDIVNYVYPEDETSVQQQTAITPDIMEFYSSKFGEYPYADEKYGHCQFGWGGGMEHTTVSFMGGFSQELIAHELAHQWFGDAVTCATWQDVWLNEGFANFLFGLVREEFNGEEAYRDWREDAVEHIVSKPGGSVYVPADQLTDVSRIFSSRLSYDKGAMVLQMLRRKLGDDDFFQALRNYLNNPDYAYGFADTENLKTELEDQSNENLTGFFDQWIYGEGFPTYHLTWSQNDNSQVQIELFQEQSKPTSVDFFKGEVPVRLTDMSGEVLDTVLNMTQNNQSFNLMVPFEVNDITVDPETEIISGANTSDLGFDPIRKETFKLYPNPARTMVYVSQPSQAPLLRITIYNTVGKKVKQLKSTDHFSVGDLNAGLYFVRLKSVARVIIKPLVVD